MRITGNIVDHAHHVINPTKNECLCTCVSVFVELNRMQ